MNKFILGVLVMFVTQSYIGCISQEEKEKAQKYKLEYVYIVQELELKDEPYIKTLNFKAKNSTDRFRIKLSYLNLSSIQRVEEKNIHKSLVGLSLEMNDKNRNQLIHTYEIKSISSLFFSTATPSVYLGADTIIKKNCKYEIILKIPPKNGTQAKYLKPTLVVGVVPEPAL